MKDLVELSAQVPIQMNGMRFDQAASELFPDFSRSRLQSWIKDGQLKVDGRVAKPKDKLIGGENLSLYAELEAQGDWEPEDIALDIVHEDEDLLVAIAGQLAAAIDLLQAAPDAPEPLPAPTAAPPVSGSALRVRHFAANDSVFINDDYLIKGVAGAIVWKLLRDHRASGRTEFTNRELRLDPALRLPDVADNLEARLLLLQRRLAEQGAALRMEKTGRGRFRLVLGRAVELMST